ncbi:MAG: class I SAM-dependent methyltransferase [Actinomycetota bacterium]
MTTTAVIEPTTPETPATPDDDTVAAFADRAFGDFLGAMNTYAMTIGTRLGWYDALADADTLNSTELATATDTDERYAREWLEQQTVVGSLEVIDPTVDATARRYRLPAAHAEVLANTESLAFMAPFASAVSTFGSHLDQLIEAYRTGDGFGWHDHGDGARCGQAVAGPSRGCLPLGPEYLASIPDVAEALHNGGRVADVGCGLGWSSIGIATAFPNTTVDGYDIDVPSIDMARQEAVNHGLDDRVRYFAGDAADATGGDYDLVLALECIHDMPDPVSVLATMRDMAGADGAVIVMDEKVGEVFTGEPDPIEQLMYGFSLICCLPDGRSAPQSVATGTVMRQPTFEGYARDAGFASVEVLPIEHDMFRFYRLHR